MALFAAWVGLGACSSTEREEEPSDWRIIYPEDPWASIDCAAPQMEPGPAIARRLTNQEYVNTVKDVLGVDVSDLSVSLPLESYADGFRNTALALNVSSRHIAEYGFLASEISERLRRREDFPGADCEIEDRACRGQFVADVGLQLFRRPMSGDERERFGRLFEVVHAEGDDFARGAALVVEAMLQSPQFLYRIETTRTHVRPASVRLDEMKVGQDSWRLEPGAGRAFEVELETGDYRLTTRVGLAEASQPAVLVALLDGIELQRWNIATGITSPHTAAFSVSAARAGAAEVRILVEPGAAGDDGVLSVAGVELSGPLPLSLDLSEIDAPQPGVRPVTGFEMASRLSYFIWHSAPDSALLEAARLGQLETPEQVEAHALRMLEDPKARRAFRAYLAEWMSFDDLGTAERSPTHFPEFGPSLVEDMKEETFRFFEDIVWDAHADFMSIFTARYSFVTPRLAQLYDLGPRRAGGGFERVDFEDDSPRAGLLTQASFLTNTAFNDDTSPVRRGQVVRTRFMCQSVPAPASNAVMEAAPGTEGLSQRERFDAHSTNAGCAFCHRLMDPIGFGFSHFDAIGAYQTHDEQGRALDASGQIFDRADNPTFHGAVELGLLLAGSPDVEQCMVEQVFQYAIGRAPGELDVCDVREMTQRFREQGRSYQDLVVAVVSSEAFRYVRAE